MIVRLKGNNNLLKLQETEGNLCYKDGDLMVRLDSCMAFYKLDISTALHLAHLKHVTNLKCQLHSSLHCHFMRCLSQYAFNCQH